MASAQSLIDPNMPTARQGGAFRNLSSQEIRLTLLIGLLHLPLGLLLYRAPSAAIVHPVAVFLIGVYWAVQRRYSLDRVALAAGYLIGAEVLWRMAQVPIYWEFGKYGSAAIMIIALIARRPFKTPQLPLVYFLALIPACLITFFEFDPVDARGFISASMSGPLALAVSCWFFSNVRLTVPHVRRILFAIITPLLSVACVTLFYTVTIEDIQFNTESNLATSGGFGPNQVSAMLGLGVLLAAGSVILFRNSTTAKVILGAIAVFFAAQSVLTFSRGGMYNAVGGLLVLILFHFRNVADGAKRVLPILGFVWVFLWVVFPALNNFTGGKLLERFEEKGTTNRIEIVQTEIEIFLEHPVFGAGIGVGAGGQGSPVTHTEFTRLIADHGSFGLVAIICLLVMTVNNLTRQRSTLGRALVAGFSVWAALFMLNAAMRLAAPSFILGMSFVTIVGHRRRLRNGMRQKQKTILRNGPIQPNRSEE